LKVEVLKWRWIC